MTISKDKMISSLLDFTKDSMSWCSGESERATMQVSKILDNIMTDSNRVSKISEDTMSAVAKFRDLIDNLDSKNRDVEMANTLVKSLKGIASQDAEVGGLIQPILEALQFQDRITQNMANMKRMIEFWLQSRQSIEKGENLSIQDFGEKLMKLTTMPDERESVRKFIDGLSNDDANAPVDVLFF